jgi:hypothetical protein
LADRIPTPDAPAVSRPKSRLWLWFVGGFLLVLIGMSFLSMDFYDGRAVYRTRVWHYYLLEIQRAWNSRGYSGPTTGMPAAAVTIACEHFLFSIAGGVFGVGIGWIVRKLARKT